MSHLIGSQFSHVIRTNRLGVALVLYNINLQSIMLEPLGYLDLCTKIYEPQALT